MDSRDFKWAFEMFTTEDWGFNEPPSMAQEFMKEDNAIAAMVNKLHLSGKQINTSVFEEAEVVK